MHVIVGHLDHLFLVLQDYFRTLCPTFWGKTSDIGDKTSDMSGCPTVFQKHCQPQIFKTKLFIWVCSIWFTDDKGEV